MLRDLIEGSADFAIVVDSSESGAFNSTVRDFAYCSRVDDRELFGTPVLLERISEGAAEAPLPKPQGRWIGMLYVRRNGLARLKAVMGQLRRRPDFETLDVPVLLNALIENGAAIEVLYVHGHWRGVNDLEELRQAVDFAHGQSVYAAAARDHRDDD